MLSRGRASLSSLAAPSAPWDPDDDEEELLEGTVMKRGMGMFVGWKERLFILTSKQLVYFEAGRLSALKGSLPLRDIKTFDMALPASRYGKRFCMSLSRASPTSPTWVLRTDSEADFIRWRDALHHAIDAARPLLPTPAARSALSPLASSAPNASNSKESSSARSSFFGLTETHPPLHPPAPSDSWSASAGMSSVASSIFNSTGSILQAGASMASLTLGGGLDDKQGNKPVQSKRSQSGRGSFPAVATANSAANSADVHGADDGYIEHNYTLGRVLERGSNGTVLAGVDKRTGEQVAIKVIDMDAGSIEDEGQKEIWLQVQHENMVRLLDYYRTDSKLYFIMELATGKDLFYGVVQHFHSAARPAGFSERDACDLTAQILTALRHLHLRRIVHCDLKPENILCYQHGGTLKLKLADWGFAQVLPSGGTLSRVLGTGSYMAPEMLRAQPYTEKVDMWSAGVIFYILLCGFPPYEAQYKRSEKAPHRNNGRGELDYGATYASILPQCDADGRWAYFPSPYWDRVSREARRLLQTMLCLDPQARASAEIALRDPWYQILRTTDTTDAGNGAGVSASAGGGGQGAGGRGLPGMMQQMRKYNASRARVLVEHCLGGVMRRFNSGAALAAAAGVGTEDEGERFILEEEGLQPLISLGWSDKADDRHLAMMALANISQGRTHALRLVHEGGMRVLLHCVEKALEAVDMARGGGEGGWGAGGLGGAACGGGEGNVEEETIHFVSMALFHLARLSAAREALIRHGAHEQLVRIATASPWTACRLQAARALAQLCLDARWQDLMLAHRAVGPLVELALQVMFQGMQKDALEGIKALATNAKLRDSLLVELRVSMAARGIGTATGGSSIASAAVGGWTSDAVGDESASLSYKSSSSSYKSMLSAFAEEEEAEKENTPPQDRLLSLMRKLERGKEGVSGGQRGDALSDWSGAGETDSLSPVSLHGALAGDPASRFRESRGERGMEGMRTGSQGAGKELLGTLGFEAGIEALEEVEGGAVCRGSSAVVQQMRVRRRGGKTGGVTGHEGRTVAVKFVMLDLKPSERQGLLEEVSRNYTCGRGVLPLPHTPAAATNVNKVKACSDSLQQEMPSRDEGHKEGVYPFHPVHPNIIVYHGAVYHPAAHRLGIVMDWVEGGSLQQLYLEVQQQSTPACGAVAGVPEGALHAVVLQVVEALVFMHRRRLIHRDIKPSSVLVRRDGLVVVTNLGNIRHLAKTAGLAASVVGTTCYFAPERIVGTSFQASADIWALGVSVLEAAAGVFPFKAHQHNYMALLEQIVTCTDVPVDRVGPTLSPALKSMLNKCLRTDAAARPSSAQLLEEEFVTRAPLAETKRLLVDLLRGLNFGGGARG